MNRLKRCFVECCWIFTVAYAGAWARDLYWFNRMADGIAQSIVRGIPTSEDGEYWRTYVDTHHQLLRISEEFRPQGIQLCSTSRITIPCEKVLP